MAIYLRLQAPSAEGTAAIKGQIEQVYSPDDAGVFSYGDADYFRKIAFERWPNLDWVMEKVTIDRYRVQADVPGVEPAPGNLNEGIPAVPQPAKSSVSPGDIGHWNHPEEG